MYIVVMLVRELGFANLGAGVLGIASLWIAAILAAYVVWSFA